MTHLVLVRHGETIWHAENRYAGRSDVPLTDLGRRQADQLAGWAAAAGLAAIWCSPLSRAHVTAQACAAATGLPERVDQRLRELDIGEAEGLTSAEMAERFPDELAAFHTDPVAHHLPGGEDPKLLVDRFLDGLHDIAGQHPDGRVLVVAHTTAIRLALCALIGVPLATYRRTFPFVRNCGITEVLLDGERAALCAAQVGLDELLHRSRIVSLHARVTDETRGMIGRDQIAALPPGSVIVNCARGALLDYDAVCDALDSGHLFGAAFDVFPEEPIPAGSRLLTTPNIVMTPHLAGASKQTAANAARIVATDVAHHLRGEPLEHCANPQVLAPAGQGRS